MELPDTTKCFGAEDALLQSKRPEIRCGSSLPLKVAMLECTEPAIAQDLKVLAIGRRKHTVNDDSRLVKNFKSTRSPRSWHRTLSRHAGSHHNSGLLTRNEVANTSDILC